MRFAIFVLIAVTFPVAAYAAMVNINTADAQLLDTLPGIGPSKAAAIVEYRTKHGQFAKTDDLTNVSGIGPATFVKLKDLVTVSGITSVNPTQEKPVAGTAGYKKVQKVEPITSIKSNPDVHVETGIAPTVAENPAAVGAALAQKTTRAKDSVSTPFRSPWVLTLFGVILVAGSMFVFM